MKKAFTMLELVVVIVLLGILASIGSEIFASVFDNYLKTRSIQNLQIQSQIAMEQIAKRLSYRIDYTLAAINDNDEIERIEDIVADPEVGLIWHVRDYESNRLKYSSPLAYTGYAYCTETANPKVCHSNGGSSLASYGDDSFLMFNADWYQSSGIDIEKVFYGEEQPICTDKISCKVEFDDTKITITNGNSSFLDTYGGYQISKKINRLIAEKDDDNGGLYDLKLYICDVGNFDSCKKGNSNAKSYLLARNVSDFRFRTLTSSKNGGTYGIMLKVCIADPVFQYDDADNNGQNFAVCKTQVVE